jgi:excisionase family DNA binding protein
MQDEMEPSANDLHDNFHALVCREPLLDSHQAAALLKVHPRTLQRLVHRGKIHAIQVGKLWRFKASALDAWMNQ